MLVGRYYVRFFFFYKILTFLDIIKYLKQVFITKKTEYYYCVRIKFVLFFYLRGIFCFSFLLLLKNKST